MQSKKIFENLLTKSDFLYIIYNIGGSVGAVIIHVNDFERRNNYVNVQKFS